MEESDVLAIIVALDTLHQGLTNLKTSYDGQPLGDLVRVSKRLRDLMGIKPFALTSEVRRRVGPNMASALDALCALLVKRLQRMPRRAELAGRVAAEIKQLEEMWRAPERLDRKERSA
jgi:hypothetical protein